MAKSAPKIPPSLMKKALYLFNGDRKKADAWFRHTQRFRVEIRPIDAIKTAKGRRAMQAYLLSQIRIAEGIFV
jgi:hypothetical protein